MESNLTQFDPILQTLPVRAKNCCKVLGIYTIEELANYVRTHDLLNLPKCGRKTAMELNEIVEEFGPSYVPQINENDFYIPSSLINEIEETFDNQIHSISDDEISNVLSNNYTSAIAFVVKTIKSPNSIFTHFKELNIKKNILSWNILLDIILQVSNIRVSHPLETVFVEKVRNSYNLCSFRLKKESNKLIFTLLPKDLLLVVEKEYLRLRAGLSNRTRNFLSKVNSSYSTILDILDDLDIKKSLGKGCGVETINDIKSTFSDFKEFLINLIDTSKQDIESLVIDYSFPFLNSKQKERVVAFKSLQGRLPFFYIVFNYFCNCKDREANIFDCYYGITTSPENRQSLADSFNLSVERVRQIIAEYKPTKILRYINYPTTEEYPFLSKDIIKGDKYFKEILESEFVSETERFTRDSFAAILHLFSNYAQYDFNGSKYLLSQRIERSFDVKNAWIDITKAFNSRITEDVSIPISSFISDYINEEIDYCIIRGLIIQLIVDNFEVEIDENDNVIFQKNRIDFEDELFKIIKQAGKPMLLEDILDEFYKSHPEYSKKSPATLKLFLLRSQRIKSVGKTSSYTLAEWNYSTLPIRGLIAAILQESAAPLSLDTLVEILEKKGRVTNKASVYSNILSDTKNNFVRFRGGLVGIGSKTYESFYEIQDTEDFARKSFSERLKEYIEFIDSNSHVPFLTKDETEASLWRWYNNVKTGVIKLSKQQKEHLQSELKEREQYIMTNDEYKFSQKCADYKYFVSTHFELPTIRTDSSLYDWFGKARREVRNLSPKKAAAYNDLIDFLALYGFYL